MFSDLVVAQIDRHTTSMMDRLTRHMDDLVAKHMTTGETAKNRQGPSVSTTGSQHMEVLLQNIKKNLQRDSNKSTQELFITQILISLAQARTTFSPKSLLQDLIKLIPAEESHFPRLNIHPGSNVFQLAEIACGPCESTRVRTRIASTKSLK